MLTLGSVLTTNVSQINLSTFAHSYSQSQARLMFVTTLGIDNFDCTKMDGHFKKFVACLREGFIHKWKQALLYSPTSPPYVAKQLTATVLLPWITQCSTNDKLRILVKAHTLLTSFCFCFF